jgi:hypothetical protein
MDPSIRKLLRVDNARINTARVTTEAADFEVCLQENFQGNPTRITGRF